jgi:hypothetical protein
MEDKSYLDRKYFIDSQVYNCPFCNRNNLQYYITRKFQFHWTKDKPCYVYLVICSSCDCISMHLSYEDITTLSDSFHQTWIFTPDPDLDIDTKIFYSVPTSFFTIDSRIPEIFRELITEAEGCLKMDFLTGASACMRKAIYELLVLEKTKGHHYEERIKALKAKYPSSDPALFDILTHIQEMTSDKIHEQSWDKWESKNIRLIIETLKTVLYDIYVTPKVKADRSKYIQQLRETVTKKHNGK